MGDGSTSHDMEGYKVRSLSTWSSFRHSDAAERARLQIFSTYGSFVSQDDGATSFILT